MALEQRPPTRDVRPVGEALAPPTFVLRIGMVLRQIKGKDPRCSGFAFRKRPSLLAPLQEVMAQGLCAGIADIRVSLQIGGYLEIGRGVEATLPAGRHIMIEERFTAPKIRDPQSERLVKIVSIEVDPDRGTAGAVS